MASSSTSSAAVRVLAMPELLELIVLEVYSDALPTIDPSNVDQGLLDQKVQGIKALHRLQGVNSRFRDVIARSKGLQRAMYLPSVPWTYEEWAYMKARPTDLNPLISELSRLIDTPWAKFTLNEMGVNLELSQEPRPFDSTKFQGSWRRTLVSGRHVLRFFIVQVKYEWKNGKPTRGKSTSGKLTRKKPKKGKPITHLHQAWLPENTTMGELADMFSELTRMYVPDPVKRAKGEQKLIWELPRRRGKRAYVSRFGSWATAWYGL